MNRETKVGLITGLAIIVMVGMLLSSYLNRQASSIKMASLSNLGSTLRHSLLRPVSDQTIPVPNVAPKGAPVAATTPPANPASGTVTSAGHTPTRQNQSAAVLSMPQYPSAPVVTFPTATSPHLAAVPAAGTMQLQNAVQSQPANAPGGQTTYTVVANDTLTRIAQHFYHDGGPVAIERIIRANPGKLSSVRSMLRIGEKLNIPSAANRVSMPQMMAVTNSGTTSNTPPTHAYRVKPGDTLYRIALVTMGAANMHNIDAIKKANGITNDRDLRVGEKLNIP